MAGEGEGQISFTTQRLGATTCIVCSAIVRLKRPVGGVGQQCTQLQPLPNDLLICDKYDKTPSTIVVLDTETQMYCSYNYGEYIDNH